jgi:MFS transporter, DHA1 family, multidrug resistance protein
MNVVLKKPVLPWAVVPICLNAFGIALSQPLLTLLGLERFPRQRGAAASMQAFLALVVNATVSGLLAPAAVSNPFTLSAVALAINAGGFILWLLTGMAKEKGAHRVAGDEGVIAD